MEMRGVCVTNQKVSRVVYFMIYFPMLVSDANLTLGSASVTRLLQYPSRVIQFNCHDYIFVSFGDAGDARYLTIDGSAEPSPKTRPETSSLCSPPPKTLNDLSG